ncbi:alkaline phosphatase D family protein [Luteolibacter algae]|uniref:Alkaline phosphatase D family protein n=1 Tax=Luteolibacter algae TaxID=454151 RepID=A0ABW5D449_9BACT
MIISPLGTRSLSSRNRMNWQPFGLGLIFIHMSLAGSMSAAEKPPGSLDLKAAHRGTPEIDIALLDLSEPPESIRSFFSEARQAFAANPMATFAQLPTIREAAEKYEISILGGPMLGAVSAEGARVWIRTRKPAQVTVQVQINGEEKQFGPVASTPESDFTAVVPVTGLQANTSHAYRVLVDGKPIPMPADSTLTTTPGPDAAIPTTIAFGADFHKTGLWNQALLERIHQQKSSALLLLGDGAVDDRENRVGLHRSDYLLRDLSPGWRKLVASTPVYATWDDHDYFNNDLSGVPKGFTAEDRSAVRKVWTQSWNNPSYGFEDRNEGIFFRTRIGPCDVIMLDTRYFRTAKGKPDNFLGEAQLQWLEKELAACTGPFIFLSSGTMWSDNITAGKDSWGTWDPETRERIFSFIEEKRIGGVMLLSGDRHGARVVRIPRASGFDFWEFELGSLGAHPGPPAIGKPAEDQPFGMIGKSLFGVCSFDTTLPDPTATIRILDAKGQSHYEVSLTRSQLTPPAR